MYKINNNIKESIMFRRNKKKEIMKVFKVQVKELFTYISSLFPNNTDITIVNNVIHTFVKYNPIKLLEIWFYYISQPYYDLIMKGDFNYFENKNYNEDLKDLNKYSAEYVLQAYNKLRLSIAKLDNNKRMTFMRYVQVITKLSEAYIKT